MKIILPRPKLTRDLSCYVTGSAVSWMFTPTCSHIRRYGMRLPLNLLNVVHEICKRLLIVHINMTADNKTQTMLRHEQ